jgi:hypothetical protein
VAAGATRPPVPTKWPKELLATPRGPPRRPLTAATYAPVPPVAGNAPLRFVPVRAARRRRQRTPRYSNPHQSGHATMLRGPVAAMMTPASPPSARVGLGSRQKLIANRCNAHPTHEFRRAMVVTTAPATELEAVGAAAPTIARTSQLLPLESNVATFKETVRPTSIVPFSRAPTAAEPMRPPTAGPSPLSARRTMLLSVAATARPTRIVVLQPRTETVSRRSGRVRRMPAKPAAESRL